MNSSQVDRVQAVLVRELKLSPRVARKLARIFDMVIRAYDEPCQDGLEVMPARREFIDPLKPRLNMRRPWRKGEGAS